MKTILLLMLWVVPALSVDWHHVSLVALTAAHVADHSTSIVASNRPHVCEANPLFRAADCSYAAWRGATIKGGLIGYAWYTQPRIPSPRARRWFTIINFTGTAVLTYIAIHNGRVGR